jgi:hypothetical protein
MEWSSTFPCDFGFHKLKDLTLMMLGEVVVEPCKLRNKVEVIFTIHDIVPHIS